jgi:hypothetical protein
MERSSRRFGIVAMNVGSENGRQANDSFSHGRVLIFVPASGRHISDSVGVRIKADREPSTRRATVAFWFWFMIRVAGVDDLESRVQWQAKSMGMTRKEA